LVLRCRANRSSVAGVYGIRRISRSRYSNLGEVPTCSNARWVSSRERDPGNCVLRSSTNGGTLMSANYISVVSSPLEALAKPQAIVKRLVELRRAEENDPNTLLGRRFL